MDTPRLKNALFISDIHLTEDRPDCSRAFFRFLEWIPEATDGLFILGDFFEYWVGDDIASPLANQVSQALRKAQQDKNLQLFFIPGNRDFSLNKEYCARCNMTLLPEQAMFLIDNKLVQLSHGDELCTDDVSYQRFRKLIRHPWVMKFLLALPKSRRIGIAERLRARSKKRFNENPVYIDVNQDTVQELAKASQADLIIHGHTHMADIHQVNAQTQRMVLGDWHHFGWYGKVDNFGASLHRFSISSPVFER